MTEEESNANKKKLDKFVAYTAVIFWCIFGAAVARLKPFAALGIIYAALVGYLLGNRDERDMSQEIIDIATTKKDEAETTPDPLDELQKLVKEEMLRHREGKTQGQGQG